MTAAEHDRLSEDVGAYLLGALDEQERSTFERHLAVCHVCHDEVERLRVAADALPRAVDQYAAPASLKRAVMEQVRSEAGSARSRRGWSWNAFRLQRPRPAFAAVVAALAVGLAGGVALSDLGRDGAPATRTIAADVDTTRVGTGRATLVVSDAGPGTLRVEAMPQLRRGQVYEVWLKRGDRIEPGPLFEVDRNGRGTAAVPADLDGVSAVMVTRERSGGARQPTEAPVITAEL